MDLFVFLWICVWAGMFTDIYYVQSPRLLSDFFTFFQAGRALLPILALFLSLILILAYRPRFVLHKTALGYLFPYCLIGLLASFFVSAQKVTSIYWGGLYLSALMVVWLAENFGEPLERLRRLLWVNCYACLFVIILTIPQTVEVARGNAPYTQFYGLPWGLGQIRVNGVGRFALIVAVFALVWFRESRGVGRVFWGFFLFLSLLTLAYTRSRTSLLGLAVVSLLYVFLQGLNLRFLVAGPVAAYILWVSGYKWRAQENLEKLVSLTGRQYTWERGLAQIRRSPLFGWGYHADRLMLDSEHMHNSYLHSMIQSGILGGLFFMVTMILIWVLMIKNRIFKRIRESKGEAKSYLMVSILLFGFLTSRSLFESTAAFYGVDLLILLPAIAYIYAWIQQNPPDQA